MHVATITIFEVRGDSINKFVFYSVSLKDYCLEKLRECEASIGLEYFQQLMNNADKSIVQKLNEQLN